MVLSTKTITEVLKDWKGGLTLGQIKDKYVLTPEQEFLIAEYSKGLTPQQIYQAVQKLKPGMKSADIDKLTNEYR